MKQKQNSSNAQNVDIPGVSIDKMDKEYMIITRTLSPPTDNRVEHVYNGKVLSKEKIVKLVNKLSDEGWKYWYNITRIELKNDELKIENYFKNYNELTHNLGSYNSSIIPLDIQIKKDLIEFLK
jgi:hypothetical protein